MGNLHKKLLSFFLLLFISMPFYVSAFPNGAGTCDVKLINTGHGESNLKGSAGYTMTAKMLSQGSFEFTVTGGTGDSVEGMLVYVTNKDNKRIGQFTNLPENMKFKTDCEGQSATVTHKDTTKKNFPFKLNWTSPQGTTDGDFTINSLVVKDFKDWAKLDDVTFNLATGTSTTVAGGASDDTGSTGSDGFLQKYTLFIIMIGITTLLYIVGSVTEAMLKRQQVKSRSFAKTIQNGFGDSR